VIIHHGDADGIAAAGLLLLAQDVDGLKSKDEELAELKYATVGYINRFLKKILNKPPEPLYILDINADDSERFVYQLKKLAHKGFEISLIDHHPFAYDQDLLSYNIKVIRDTEMSAAELVYKTYISAIPSKDREKASFLLLLGALGDKKITPFVDKIMKEMRQETIFDVHAVLMAGKFDSSFLRSLFYDRDKNGIGFTKKIYEKAVDKRFFLEKVKKFVIKHHVWIKSLNARIVNIYSPYIGLAAGYLIDQECDFAIAIGDGKPPLRIIVKDYLKRIFSLGLSKDFRIWERQKNVRISFRTKKPVNDLVKEIAKQFDGTGGGHKYACGANIPKETLDAFIRKILKDFAKL